MLKVAREVRLRGVELDVSIISHRSRRILSNSLHCFVYSLSTYPLSAERSYLLVGVVEMRLSAVFRV
jgi:hypothetical protein